MVEYFYLKTGTGLFSKGAHINVDQLEYFYGYFLFCASNEGPGPAVIKLFSCSTQLSMKFLMLISIKITENLALFKLS